MPWILFAPWSVAVAAPDLEDLARNAFVWAYPLVVSSRTMTGPGVVNELTWAEELSDDLDRNVVMPNNDTLYVSAFLDLRSEPMVLDVIPPADERYFSYEFLDAWMEAFAYVGTRATDGRAGTWVITPPGWRGELPEGVVELRSATPQVALLGRYAVIDEVDVQWVLAARDDVLLMPLSEYTHTRPPPPPPPTPARGLPSEVGQQPLLFWDELGDCLAINPPRTRAEIEFLASLSVLGVGRGRHPSQSADPEVIAALIQGAQAGMELIRDGSIGADRNGWNMSLNLGLYGTDYLQRAVVAQTAWGANVAEEALYPSATRDVTGLHLDGSRADYRIVFPPGQLPPAEAFWSITVYDQDGFLVANRIDRFSIGSRTRGLRYGRTGGLDLVLSPSAPPDARNWLPIPDGRFRVTLRMYLPGPTALDGTWTPPPIEPLGAK